MNFDIDFSEDEYYDENSDIFDFSMDYLFSANVSACEYTERTNRLLDSFRKENSVVTFTFSDGKIVNTADIFGVTASLDGVCIEFLSRFNDLTAQINVLPVSENEYEIIFMLPHEELKKLDREKLIFDIASEFFDCLSPRYGVTGEEVFASPADEITDDEFISFFSETGYIDNCQYNMTSRARSYKSKFVIYPLRNGEMFVSKAFDRELHRSHKKKRLFGKD